MYFSIKSAKIHENTKNITLRYLLIVVVIKYSLLKSKMAETRSGSGSKAAVYHYYWVFVLMAGWCTCRSVVWQRRQRAAFSVQLWDDQSDEACRQVQT